MSENVFYRKEINFVNNSNKTNKVNIKSDGTASFVSADVEKIFLEAVKAEAAVIASELISVSHLSRGKVLVVGCSSSEVTGNRIGKASIPSVADAILDGMLPVLRDNGIYLAAQCCEHLNRAIIIERELADRLSLDEVAVIPVPKAGGSFASACYSRFENPVAVEAIKADAGIDIGGTLIGMHLRAVAVPVRLSLSKLGEANIICARTRPKYIGGERAVYTKEN